MKRLRLLLLSFAAVMYIVAVSANNQTYSMPSIQEGQGIDLNEYAFAIPLKNAGFGEHPILTLSFWVKVKEFNHGEEGTTLFNVRDVLNGGFPDLEYGWLWSNLGPGRFNKNDEGLTVAVDNVYSNPYWALPFVEYDFEESKWYYFTFVLDYNQAKGRDVKAYVNAELVYENNTSAYYTDNFYDDMILMIGGFAQYRAPLNAYIDKVQIYEKVLSVAEVEASMQLPLLNDSSLFAYWDFEDDILVDSDGFLPSCSGSSSLKATMYEVGKYEYEYGGKVYASSMGLQIQPFDFVKGADPYTLLGVEESLINEDKVKVYISNEMLKIENAEGINSVVVYDATGKVIASANVNGATSTQIALPSTIKGVIMVKVNSEVIKVICN